MNTITLSNIASICLTNSDRATSLPERIVWIALARSIVAQETRAKRVDNLVSCAGVMTDAVRYFSEYKRNESAHRQQVTAATAASAN